MLHKCHFFRVFTKKAERFKAHARKVCGRQSQRVQIPAPLPFSFLEFAGNVCRQYAGPLCVMSKAVLLNSDS